MFVTQTFHLYVSTCYFLLYVKKVQFSHKHQKTECGQKDAILFCSFITRILIFIGKFSNRQL
jgi:hypothetical protein